MKTMKEGIYVGVYVGGVGKQIARKRTERKGKRPKLRYV